MGTPYNRIWRTVVFAGAMLATPLAGCSSSTPKPVTGPQCDASCREQADMQAKADEQARHDADAKAAADEQARRDAELVAQKQAEDDAARKAEEEKQAAAEAEKKRLEEEEAQRQWEQRIRGSGKGKRGRGFVLS